MGASPTRSCPHWKAAAWRSPSPATRRSRCDAWPSTSWSSSTRPKRRPWPCSAGASTMRSGSAHPPILAVAHSPNVEARVGLLEAGADDVLAQPIDPRELEALVEALLLRAPGAAAAGADAARDPAADAGWSGPRHRVRLGQGGLGHDVTCREHRAGAGRDGAGQRCDRRPGHVPRPGGYPPGPLRPALHGRPGARGPLEPKSRRSSPRPAVATAAGLLVFGGPYRPDDATRHRRRTTSLGWWSRCAASTERW